LGLAAHTKAWFVDAAKFEKAEKRGEEGVKHWIDSQFGMNISRYRDSTRF